jgi:hypothetical protein
MALKVHVKLNVLSCEPALRPQNMRIHQTQAAMPLFEEGLMGGTISSAWPLLNIAEIGFLYETLVTFRISTLQISYMHPSKRDELKPSNEGIVFASHDSHQTVSFDQD